MGYVADWNRKSFAKVAKLADGGTPDMPEPEEQRPRLQAGGGGGQTPDGRQTVGGFVSYDVGDGDKISIEGGGSADSFKSKGNGNRSSAGGGYRLGYTKELDGDKSIGVGTSGYRYSGESEGQKYHGGKDFNGVDVRYRDKDAEYSAGYDMESKRAQVTYRKRF